MRETQFLPLLSSLDNSLQLFASAPLFASASRFTAVGLQLSGRPVLRCPLQLQAPASTVRLQADRLQSIVLQIPATAFAKKIGSSLKQTVSLTPSVYQLRRYMSSSMHFTGGVLFTATNESLSDAFNVFDEVAHARMIIGNESDKPGRSGFVTFNCEEISTSAMYTMDEMQNNRSYGCFRNENNHQRIFKVGHQVHQVRAYASSSKQDKNLQTQTLGGYRGPPPSGAGGYGAPPQSSRCNYGLASDIYLKSYFNSIRPPTSSTFGFRLGKCIIMHFPKTTFIHLFAPRQPMQMRQNENSESGKEKGRWWGFGKVRPIKCLQSSDDTKKKEKKEVGGQDGDGKKAELARRDDREKLSEIRSSLKRTQRYGYHVHTPLRKNNFKKLLKLSGTFKYSKQSGVVNDLASLVENNEAFKKTKLFKFLSPKKSHFDGSKGHVLTRSFPALRGL